jgi:ABC transporter substrate binding protein
MPRFSTLRNYRPVGRRKGNMSLSDPLAAGVVVDLHKPGLSGIRIRLPRRRLIFLLYFIDLCVTMNGSDGGLLSYGVDQVENWRRAATYVDRILHGANPAELPVQLPTKYDMVVNLKTAKALGLTVPQSILLSADEVIE